MKVNGIEVNKNIRLYVNLNMWMKKKIIFEMTYSVKLSFKPFVFANDSSSSILATKSSTIELWDKDPSWFNKSLSWTVWEIITKYY